MTRQDLVTIIDQIDQAILRSIVEGVASFSVAGGTSYTNISTENLRAMRGEYAMMLYRYDYSADGTTVRTFPQWQGTTSVGNQ